MRKKAVLFAAVATALVAVVAPAANAERGDTTPGAVYALTNSTSGNGVAYYARSASGALNYVATYATGGNGTGAGLGSQGAVAVSGDTLFAVNAGSDSISAFAVRDGALNLETTFASNGVRPISLTVHGNLLYVLNAGGSGSITGFRLGGGDVEALDGSTQPLLGTNPAQISFSPDGSTLVVTEKGSQTIDTFSVGRQGIAQPGVSSPSAGATPFGFAFDNRGRAFVSEAAGSASSYSIDSAGAHLIAGPVLTHQAAPCWLVVTKNGRFAYTANAGAGSISGFSIAPDGSIELLDPSTGATVNLGAGSHPLDEAVSEDGRFLYVLVDGRHTIAGFSIGVDGSLTPVGEVGTLPAGAIGLTSL